MKVTFACLFAVLLGWSAAAQEPRPMELEDLFRIKRVSDPQASPDGKWVAFVVTAVDKAENKTDSDVWLVSASGGEPRQLTNSPKHDRHPRWAPDSRQLVFESNRSGAFQLYVISLDGGEARQLTTISTEATQPVWSPDGKHIAFVSAVFPEFSEKSFKESDAVNKKRLDEREKSKVKARVLTQLLYRHWDSWVDDKRQHLFVVSPEGGEPRDLTPGDRDAVPTSSTFSAGDDFDFSPDGKELAYTATPVPTREEAWSTNHDLYTVELASGKRKQLTKNPAADAFPRYAPDGRFIAYRAQERAGFEADRWQLMLLDRATGKTRSLTKQFDSWVEGFVWAPDSKTIYFEAEGKALKPLWSVSVGGDDVKKVHAEASSGELSSARQAETLAFTRSSLSRPAEVFVLEQGRGEARALTRLNDDLFSRITMSPPESIWLDGAGGTKVQMWIVKPPDFSARKKHPLVFWVHGGPQGAYLDSWSYRWNAQVWAAQGYVLALPNPRGSSGFGQKFTDEITRDWGGRVFDDLMRGLAVMEKQPYLDTKRMAAAGASYGGYMMNWFQGHTDKFKTLVTHCGVFNFHNMYGTTEELWFDEWEHGIPWETPDFDKHSPHRFAKHFTTPNLIIHNELDFRVPISEGLSLFTTLQRKGVPSKLLYFPDEGHWVLKPQNSELWHKTIFEWLAEYLKK
ncbi:MAG: S9 family peptidase [Verrucomicrobia bacterium]|nr:S9 family peptidase [Verrucomicrobiota bacterium]